LIRRHTFVLFVVFYSIWIVGASAQDSIVRPKSPVSLYFKEWDPNTRELRQGLHRSDTENGDYVEVLVSGKGLVKIVKLYDAGGKHYLSYHLTWNKQKTWAHYWIEAEADTPLTVIDDLLIAHDLSDLRPGYRVDVVDKRAKGKNIIKVYDEIGSFLYFYTFSYVKKESGAETITSSYFKYDSTLVGYHKLDYNKAGYLRSIDYYDFKDNIKYSLGYQYNLKMNEISRSIIDKDGFLLEKRILPMKAKYRRRVLKKRAGGVSLSDAISFLDNATEEDVDALALMIEQRFRKEIQRVDTTYSPILNIIDTMIVEKEVPVMVKQEKKPRDRRLFYALEAGNSIRSGSLFSNGSAMSVTGSIATRKGFKFLFLSSLKPYISGNAVFYDKASYPGFSIGLLLPGRFPLGIPFTALKTKLPLVLSGGGGWSKVGPEINAGIKFERGKKFKMYLKFDSSIYFNAFSSGSISGLIQMKLGLGF